MCFKWTRKNIEGHSSENKGNSYKVEEECKGKSEHESIITNKKKSSNLTHFFEILISVKVGG